MFEGRGFGDMFVEYNVVLPTSITPTLRKSKPDYIVFVERIADGEPSAELIDAFSDRVAGKDEL